MEVRWSQSLWIFTPGTNTCREHFTIYGVCLVTFLKSSKFWSPAVCRCPVWGAWTSKQWLLSAYVCQALSWEFCTHQLLSPQHSLSPALLSSPPVSVCLSPSPPSHNILHSKDSLKEIVLLGPVSEACVFWPRENMWRRYHTPFHLFAFYLSRNPNLKITLHKEILTNMHFLLAFFHIKSNMSSLKILRAQRKTTCDPAPPPQIVNMFSFHIFNTCCFLPNRSDYTVGTQCLLVPLSVHITLLFTYFYKVSVHIILIDV